MPLLAIDPLTFEYSARAAHVRQSAIELGVFEALANSRLDLEALRLKIGIDRRGAGDFFDSLVALGLLDRDDQARYANTREPNPGHAIKKPPQFCRSADRPARRAAVWRALTAALRTGCPQLCEPVANQYDTLYRDEAAVQAFVANMTFQTLSVAKALAKKIPWRRYGTFMDIGSAQGCLPVEIATAHPHVTGGGFDLPAVKNLFDSYVGEHGLTGRLQFFPGNFFQDSLPSAEVLICGRLLHNFDLPTKRMLLAKAYQALPSNGVLIVYERLIDDERRDNAIGLLSSLNMLLTTPGGFDYSGADCVNWMRDAGFRDMRIEPLANAHSMVIAHK